MVENRNDPTRLLKIKSHIGFHGFGCAIVDDHVAIDIAETEYSPGCFCKTIKRVRSFDEARKVIGCHCCEPDRDQDCDLGDDSE